MSDWVFLRQIRIRMRTNEVIVQPFVNVWWTLDEEELLIDCQSEIPTPDFLYNIQRPNVMTIPLCLIEKIEIWIEQGKETPEKHVILDKNDPPNYKKPIN